MDRFSQILYDLGKEVGTDLYPDENRICQLNYKEELTIQITYDESKERLLFVTFVCEVPAGKYRETLFKGALKSNGMLPQLSILAYTGRNNQLTQFAYFPASEHSMEKLFTFLKGFIDKASAWKDAIENGRTLPSETGPKGSDGAMFGLKP